MERKEMGSRIRQLRRSKKLSLRAVSRATGIAVSFLSAVEAGRNNVSVAKLKAMLDVLGMSLGEFFSQGVRPPKVIYRSKEFVELAGSGKGISFREVAAGRPGRLMQFTLERYKPGADTGPEMYQYNAEEAGVVLKGKLELTVESEVYVLGPGDAYYINNNRPHRFRNIGRREVLAVSANTPPTF